MKRSEKVVLAAGILAVGGGLLLVGTSFAERGFGGPRGMMGGFGYGHMGMLGGPIVHEMIASVDANKDGALSQEEINNALSARMAEFDADKNNSLSLQEFEALWAEITRPLTVRAFQFLDPDGDAAVAKSEIDERFGTLVSRFDRNDDGMLSHDDHHRHRGGWRHGRRDRGPEHRERMEDGAGEQ